MQGVANAPESRRRCSPSNIKRTTCPGTVRRRRPAQAGPGPRRRHQARRHPRSLASYGRPVARIRYVHRWRRSPARRLDRAGAAPSGIGRLGRPTNGMCGCSPTVARGSDLPLSGASAAECVRSTRQPRHIVLGVQSADQPEPPRTVGDAQRSTVRRAPRAMHCPRGRSRVSGPTAPRPRWRG
jgi:hypothetical protein